MKSIVSVSTRLTVAISLILPLSAFLPAACGHLPFDSTAFLSDTQGSIDFTILHTNDLHSQFEGSGPDSLYSPTSDGSPVQGGLSRLATAIGRIRAEKATIGEGTLLVDAGDFYAGTLFHTLGPSAKSTLVPELQFLSTAKYDALTFGNHEFDARTAGLVRMLQKAESSKLLLPFVFSNLRPEGMDVGFKHFVDASASNAPVAVAPTRLTTLTSHGSKLVVGFVGVLGSDAAQLSLGSRQNLPVSGFDDGKNKKDQNALANNVRESVQRLRKQGAQVVVALVHGGIDESTELASKAGGISVVVGGHSHSVYTEEKSGVVYAQAGALGGNLGVLPLRFDRASGRVALRRELPSGAQPINDSLPTNPAVDTIISRSRQDIGRALAGTGFAYDSPVIEVRKDSLPKSQSLDPFGRFAASQVLKSLNKHLAKPVDFYFITSGIVRGGFKTNAGSPVMYQFSDVFKILSLGFDDAFQPGSPIVAFYLHKDEAKKLLETCEGFALLGNGNAFPVVSDNITYRINGFGIPLVNRVDGLALNGVPFSNWPPLVRVATNGIVGRYFDKFGSVPFGLADIHPRDENGNVLGELPRVEAPREYMLFAESLKKLGVFQ